VKKVEHPDGGVVAEILVRDGDRVRAGDTLVSLDATIPRSALAIVSKGLDELAALRARLQAEREGSETVTMPHELVSRASDPEVARVIKAAHKLFEIRRLAREGQKKQLRQRIGQLHEEIAGNESRISAKTAEIRLIGRELDGARELWGRNLMPISKLTALEREATRIEGEKGQLASAIAQIKGKISEVELQIIQVELTFVSEAGKELREVEAKIGEFIERKIAAEERFKRLQIRAPQDGIVHQMKVETVGGVISPGEPIMSIVPEADDLVVEAKVAPHDIDQLTLQQEAVLHFSAFNQRTTPEVLGEIARISADTTTDERNGQSYYTIRIVMDEDQVARLGDVDLVPGIPVEAFLRTGERKVLSYLMKPFNDQLARAFREE